MNIMERASRALALLTTLSAVAVAELKEGAISAGPVDGTDGNGNCSCWDEQVLDRDCCSCTSTQVARAASLYFKGRMEQLVQAPLFRVYTPYPDFPGKELYDVECSVPEFQDLAQELSELQLGCAIEQCGCSRDTCGPQGWRHQPCFRQCEGDSDARRKGTTDLVMTVPAAHQTNDDPVQYDLIDNPEQFTGYGTLLDDRSAGMIWQSLYSDNFCFSACPDGVDAEPSVEKRLVFKIVSGLQASINTHISMHYGFIAGTDQPATLESWDPASGLDFRPWKALFDERVGQHPGRVQNMHLVFALLTRALHRLEPHMDRFLEAGASACPHCASQHNQTRDLLRELVSPPDQAPAECGAVLQAFDDAALFRGEDAGALRQEVSSRLQRMGNLMTCVGCDRCKLWGTLQFHAVRVAFGIILAEADDDTGDFETQFAVPAWASLKPNDVVALVNALAQVSKSIDQARLWMEDQAVQEQ